MEDKTEEHRKLSAEVEAKRRQIIEKYQAEWADKSDDPAPLDLSVLGLGPDWLEKRRQRARQRRKSRA